MFNKESLVELFKKFLDTTSEDELKHSTEKPSNVNLAVIKKFEDEKMESIEVLYCAPLEADAHGEGMTEVEIRKMVDNFNANIDKIKGNFGHVINTDKFSPVKAWVNECDCIIGEEEVKEGLPLVKLKFHDPELFQKRKDGIFKGISISARGRRKKVEK